MKVVARKDRDKNNTSFDSFLEGRANYNVAYSSNLEVLLCELSPF